MTTATNKFTQVESGTYFRQVWKKESALFGLLSWSRLVFQERVGEALRIVVDRVPEDVILNGIKYVPQG
jgi:hypothetical protein